MVTRSMGATFGLEIDYRVFHGDAMTGWDLGSISLQAEVSIFCVKEGRRISQISRLRQS